MKRFTTYFPYVICAVALILLARELEGISFKQLTDEVWARGPWPIVTAFGVLGANFSVMSLYDWIALRQIRARIPFRTVLVTAVQSFAITNLVSHSIITGLAMRARAYGQYGIGLPKLTQITVMNVETWWLGFASLFGIVLVSTPLPELREYSSFLNLGGGLLLLGGVAAYLGGCAWTGGRVVKVRSTEIHLPSLGRAMQKAIVGAVDTTLVSFTLYTLMPGSLALPFRHFLALHLIAHFLGVIAMVPGGLGVLEGVLLKLLEPYGEKSALLAGILLFRVVHYLVPAALAMSWMSIRDLRLRRAALTKLGGDQ